MIKKKDIRTESYEKRDIRYVVLSYHPDDLSRMRVIDVTSDHEPHSENYDRYIPIHELKKMGDSVLWLYDYEGAYFTKNAELVYRNGGRAVFATRKSEPIAYYSESFRLKVITRDFHFVDGRRKTYTIEKFLPDIEMDIGCDDVEERDCRIMTPDECGAENIRQKNKDYRYTKEKRRYIYRNYYDYKFSGSVGITTNRLTKEVDSGVGGCRDIMGY